MVSQCTRLKTKASYTKLQNIPPKINELTAKSNHTIFGGSIARLHLECQ